MCTIILSLISGLVGSLLGAFITLDAVRRTEYFRLVAVFKRALREIEADLNSAGGHPASKLDSRMKELNPIYDDVIRLATWWRQGRIREAWEHLTCDNVAKDKLNMNTTPAEYTKAGTVEGKKLICERIHRLISVL